MRPDSLQPIGAVSASLFCLAAAYALFGSGFADLITMVLFVLAVAALDSVDLRLPRGGHMSMIGGIVAAQVAILPAALAVMCTLSGCLLASGLKQDAAARLALGVLRKTALVLPAAAAFGFVSELLQPAGSASLALSCLLAGGLYAVLDMAIFSSTAPEREADRVHAFASIVRLVGVEYLGQLSVGAALAVAYPEGLAARVVYAIVLVALMVVMQFSFGMLMRVRSAYNKTIEALVRLTELQQVGVAGHGQRVASLAVAAGRRLGLAYGELEQLGMAAVLHDIGSIKSAPGVSGTRRAAAGAEVVSTIPFLAQLAPIIALSSQPFGAYIDLGDRTGLLARVIHAASALDEATEGGSARLESVRSALLADEVDADPKVTEALEADAGRVPKSRWRYFSA